VKKVLMRRPRRVLLAAVPLALVLTGCGSQSASQGSVRDDVRDALLDRGEDAPSSEAASEIADCVARGIFEGDFTKEQRDDITRAVDGDEPSEALTAEVQALLDGCEADASGGAEGDSSDEG
jgi:hypothetical protein